MENYLSPTNDYVFKRIFGGKIWVLEDFLKSVLDLPAEDYKGLTVVDPNLDLDYIDGKLGILDVKVHTGSGKVIDIEMQVKPQRSIWQRMLFYTSKMVVEQLKTGYEYSWLNRVISILIVDFVMIKENDINHNRFRLFDQKTMACFPDSIEINVLEMPKGNNSENAHLNKWMQFFRAKTEEDFMAAALTSPAINEAWGVIKVLSGDEQERAKAAAREKAQMDLDSMLGDARYEARQEGRQEGLMEGLITVARNLLRTGKPCEEVVDVTGLSFEKVKLLAAELSSC